MGYCRDGGIWISSYTYRNFLNNQRVYGLASLQELQQPQEVLYVRASLNADDKASLQPIYHMNAVPSPATTTGDYWVQLMDLVETSWHVIPWTSKQLRGMVRLSG